MQIEQIVRRQFLESDRAMVQERVCSLVETDPEQFLATYRRDPRSFNGRYVNSDLMKELFADYSASREQRNRYNYPVHNAAAVLAAAQFYTAIADQSVPERSSALFLTGVPGAGKTTSLLVNAQEFPADARIVYEGQLAEPVNAVAKLRAALTQGLNIEIVAIHISSRQALLNTLNRFEKEGRGASIEALARIQGNLAHGLKQIEAHFGERIGLTIIDKRDKIKEIVRGWKALPLLESEGTYESIREKLNRFLEAQRAIGQISSAAYQQALGKTAPVFN